jgi:hypothetical protein
MPRKKDNCKTCNIPITKLRPGASGYCRRCQHKTTACTKCSNKISPKSTTGICRPCYDHWYCRDPEKKALKKTYNDNWRSENKKRLCQQSIQWQRRNPDRIKEIRKRGREKIENRFIKAKIAAKRRGLDFLLGWDQYSSLVKHGFCHYCKTLHLGHGVGLDRLDNSRGYEPGNVVPCCGDCNKTRGDRLTHEEMVAAMRAVSVVRSVND